jgi:hypothetical protein
MAEKPSPPQTAPKLGIPPSAVSIDTFLAQDGSTDPLDLDPTFQVSGTLSGAARTAIRGQLYPVVTNGVANTNAGADGSWTLNFNNLSGPHGSQEFTLKVVYNDSPGPDDASDSTTVVVDFPAAAPAAPQKG